MAYIYPDKLLELRSIDLLSYLKRSDPTNLVRGLMRSREFIMKDAYSFDTVASSIFHIEIV